MGGPAKISGAAPRYFILSYPIRCIRCRLGDTLSNIHRHISASSPRQGTHRSLQQEEVFQAFLFPLEDNRFSVSKFLVFLTSISSSHQTQDSRQPLSQCPFLSTPQPRNLPLRRHLKSRNLLLSCPARTQAWLNRLPSPRPSWQQRSSTRNELRRNMRSARAALDVVSLVDARRSKYDVDGLHEFSFGAELN